MKGLDFSWARPNPALIKSQGYDFVIRYVDFPGASGKGLTKPEYDGYLAANFGVGLIFESTSGRALEGINAGIQDGMQCLVQAELLGWPEDKPYYFAVDFDATPANFPAIDAYLTGAARAIGSSLIGVYGSYSVIEHCFSANTAAYFWQTYAWSGGAISTHHNIFQYQNGVNLSDGSLVDLNTASNTNSGVLMPTQPSTLTVDELNNAIMAREALRALASGDYNTVQKALMVLRAGGIAV